MSSTKAARGVFLADADVTSAQHAREEPWAQPRCCSAVFIYLLRVKAARPHVRDVPLPGRPVPSCSKCPGLPPSCWEQSRRPLMSQAYLIWRGSHACHGCACGA